MVRVRVNDQKHWSNYCYNIKIALHTFPKYEIQSEYYLYKLIYIDTACKKKKEKKRRKKKKKEKVHDSACVKKIVCGQK